LAMADVVIYYQPAEFWAEHALFLGVVGSATHKQSLADAVGPHLPHLGVEMDGPVAILWREAQEDERCAVLVELNL
jgi:uncharacterized OB-fold protein